MRDMDAREKARALALLDHADQTNPLVQRTRDLLEAAPVRPEDTPSLATRALRSIRARYFSLTEKRWFTRVVIAVFVLWALTTMIEIASLLTTLSAHLSGYRDVRIAGPITGKPGHFGFVRGADLAFSIVSGALVIWGMIRLRRSRAAAYEWFERALLISLLITQVFAFLESQFGACLGFLLDLLLLITVRFMLSSERELELVGRPTDRAEATLAPPVPA